MSVEVFIGPILRFRETARPNHGSECGPHYRPSYVPARFSQPMVAMQGSLFLLCDDDGNIRADSDQDVYFHDMRYFSPESLRFNDTPPVSLLADAKSGATWPCSS
jgi:hypothetical protein